MNATTSPAPAHVIRLDQLDSPLQSQTVHVRTLERLVKQVDASVAQAVQQAKVRAPAGLCGKPQPWLESLQPLDQGHTSFIDGTRGAGKTTFLRAACRALCKELRLPAGEAPPAVVAQSTLCFLGLMDPSRVENGENILLNVVRAVQRRVEDATPTFGERSRQEATQQFNATLEKLATGLSLLHAQHDPLKDIVDPEVFVSLQLERVGEGEQLRSTFHTLLEHACCVLGADALVLAFDDADTSAHKGGELMECLRKYLNSPRLVVLVAGDMELYAQLARRKMVANVGKDVEGAKPERQTQHHRMLDHLEEQYLLKVFPVQRRFQLLPLKNVDQHEGLIQAQWQSRASETAADLQPQTAALSALLTFTLQYGLFIKDVDELALHRDYFLSWPIRSILQVLARCTPLLVVEGDQIKLRGTATDAKAAFALLQTFQRTFTEAVRYACLGGLYAHGVDVDAIAQDHFPALIKAVVDVVLEQGSLDNEACLRPTSTSESLNACFFALSAEVARLCMGRPDRAIAYMLMGPGTVSAFQSTLHRREEEKPDAVARVQITPPTVEEFKRYMGLGQSADPMEWAWRVAPIWGRAADNFDLSKLSKFRGKNEKPENDRIEAYVRLLYLHQVGTEPTKSLSITSDYSALALLGKFFDAAVRLKNLDPVDSTPPEIIHELVNSRGPSVSTLPRWMACAESASSWVKMPGTESDCRRHLSAEIYSWLKMVQKNGFESEIYSAMLLDYAWGALHFRAWRWYSSEDDRLKLNEHLAGFKDNMNHAQSTFAFSIGDVPVHMRGKKMVKNNVFKLVEKYPLLKFPLSVAVGSNGGQADQA